MSTYEKSNNIINLLDEEQTENKDESQLINTDLYKDHNIEYPNFNDNIFNIFRDERERNSSFSNEDDVFDTFTNKKRERDEKNSYLLPFSKTREDDGISEIFFTF